MNETPQAPPSPYFLDWAWEHKLLMLPIVLALAFSLCGGCFGLAYVNSLQAMRQNPLHRQAVQAARDNEIAAAELGLPIDGGFILEGTIEVDDLNQEGYADCMIPVKGSQGTGKLFVKGKLHEGNWTVNSLKISLEQSGQILTLVDEEAAQKDAPNK